MPFAVLLLLTVLGGALVLHRFNPSEHAFYPKCLLHETTGLHCPGCGATRACHAILRGDVGAALRFNPVFVIGLPALAYGMLALGVNQWTRRRLPPLTPSPRVIWWLGAVLIGFAILRNLPFPPFTLLAPADPF